MVKKVAVINDLSGFGKCSLTAAIPVLSAMGAEACPLPTAILSAQTGYASYYYEDHTDKMENFRREWEKMSAAFDGIYTGFLTGEDQVDQIFRFLDTFDQDQTFLLVDPVMGDEGKVHKMFTPVLLSKMKDLTAAADAITPNVTELCLLGDADFQEIDRQNDIGEKLSMIGQISEGLLTGETKLIVVTGIRYKDPENEENRIGNLAVTKEQLQFSDFPYVGGSYSGTGDLFTSVLMGGLLRGDDLAETMDLAGRFVERSIWDAAQDEVDRNAGTNFEKYIGMLIR